MSVDCSTEFLLKHVQTVLKAVPAGILVVEQPSQKVVYANENLVTFCGFDPNGFDLKSSLGRVKFYVSAEQPREPENIPAIEALMNGVKVDDEMFLVENSEGRRMLLSLSVLPILDEKGLLVGSVGVFVDFTEQKRLEDELKLSQDRYRAAVEGCNDGIWDRDLKTHKVFFSDQWKRMLGYTPEEIPNNLSEFNQLIHPDDRNNTWGKIEAHIRGETPFYRTEFRMKHKDGSWRWILSRGSVLRDPDGVAYRIAGSHTDITESKKITQALERHNKELEALVEERTKTLKAAERLAAIGQTAGMVGHDIRNPLQSIVSEIYLAKEDLSVLPESQEKSRLLESCDSISKAIDYINKIVLDLQDYARPLKPAVQQIDLRKFVDELLRRDMPKNIQASCYVEDNAANVFVDSAILKRIIGNLVINAVQAMPDGGCLWVDAHQDASGLVITVEDTGVGIPLEAKKNLFRPLFTTKPKGQGFGLAVVKRLVEVLDGSITFESTIGKGTKFTIIMPQPKQTTIDSSS